MRETGSMCIHKGEMKREREGELNFRGSQSVAYGESNEMLCKGGTICFTYKWHFSLVSDVCFRDEKTHVCEGTKVK